MVSANATNIYCPGCSPGDFQQPHICGRGVGLGITSVYCALCNTFWTGGHVCMRAFQEPYTEYAPAALPNPEPPRATCDHCFCLKQKAGDYRVPSPTSHFGHETYRLEAHLLCCNCGNRRVKD